MSMMRLANTNSALLSPLLAASLAALFPSAASAQLEIANQAFDDLGTRAEVRSVFDPLPPTGCAPLRVVVTNATERDTTWDFDFESRDSQYQANNSHSSRFALPVPARRTGSAMFIVPLAVGYGQQSSVSYNNHNLRCSIASTAHAGQEKMNHDPRVTDYPAIAISKALADSSITKLNDEVEQKRKSSSRGGGGGGRSIFGSRFDVNELPEDWLGYSGFDYVLLSSPEWAVLKPGVKSALLQWARLGGQIHIYRTANDPVIKGQPGSDPAADGQLSLGAIKSFNWNGKDLAAFEVASRYWGERRRETILVDGYTGHTSSGPHPAVKTPSWGLLKDLGSRSFASWQVILFLLVFGILVGPVNLFVLAPAGKRHKLFFTTPLLSLAASGLMIVLILFQDGIGGTGRRLTVVNVEPQETAAYVTQEQASRTGVLLSAGFDLPAGALIEPLALPDTDWVKLKSTHDSQGAALSQDGRSRSGNFFQSRAEQGQLIRAAISTRSRVELKSGGDPAAPPTLISALGFTVKELFYLDDNGKYWKTAAPLTTGQQVQLVEAPSGEYASWWKTVRDDAGKQSQESLNKLSDAARGKFFATAAEAPGFVIDSLKSIRWEDDQVIVFGAVAKP